MLAVRVFKAATATAFVAAEVAAVTAEVSAVVAEVAAVVAKTEVEAEAETRLTVMVEG